MRITSKGQVTIPQYIREEFHLYPNTEVVFKAEAGRVYIEKNPLPNTLRDSPFDYGRGAATLQMTTEEIMALTRSDVSSPENETE
ncbi:MAG: AbrB/MazE/SpoVT family DNA-binding domain-containing protein [Deltaproteobacteria bacterium]|nr:AbrB/MazE/SpoVT family DNA-binding domain-containing protein [Deltaproteobacteria bacterium]MBN2673029.1 AbrB/MazE/SpoVT family DNA-binding domain-containing protein [Deltaproteobacteria bacterium]